MLVDGKNAGRAAEGMAARSRGMGKMMTRKSELEESGVWQTLEKKKDWSLASSEKKKERENLHTYTHSRIERYIQADTVGRRPGA